MFYSLYDRNLNSIGKTYTLESWSRTRRSVDFDNATIVGEQIPYWVEPFFVDISDEHGRQIFSGLASTPQIDEKNKKTTISLKDYITLFNSDIVVDWGDIPSEGLRLSEYLDYILTKWKEQIFSGFSAVFWDLSDLENVYWDKDITLGEGKESVSAQVLIQDALNLYNLYKSSRLDVSAKSLTFYFGRQGRHETQIKLRDFGVDTVEKSFGEYNRVSVYDSSLTLHHRWALTQNNTIMKISNPGDERSSDLVYPAKNRNFVARQPDDSLTQDQAIYDALYDALMGLANNRYQESITLDVQKAKSLVDLSSVGFDYTVTVYAENGLYRNLPVGSISEDSAGKHSIVLGRSREELTQEV